jgi:hypothetical protein
VATPPVTDPPYVPIPRTAWPVRRTPRWLLVALAVLAAGAVAVGLAHKPSQAQRASDLRAFLSTMRYDIDSCAAGVSDSRTALSQIDSGASHDRATAIDITRTGANDCSPANNMLLEDLTQYQVSESLASLHLQPVVSGLLTWATPDAIRVQADVGKVLTARGAQAAGRSRAELAAAVRQLDAQRSAVNAVIGSAIRSVGGRVTPLKLPG